MSGPLPSRRSFLGGALALPAGLALGAPVGASAASPLRDLFRRYSALLARIRERNGAWGAPAHLKPAQEADTRALEGLKAQIEAQPITSMEDLALVLWTVTGGLAGPPSQVRDRCNAFLAEENLQ